MFEDIMWWIVMIPAALIMVSLFLWLIKEGISDMVSNMQSSINNKREKKQKAIIEELVKDEKERLQCEYEVLCEIKEEELKILERERDKAKKEYEKAQSARELFEKRIEDYEIKKRELQEESNAIIKRYNEAYQTVRRDVLRELSSPMRLDPVREEQFVNEFFSDKGGRAVTEKMDFSKLNVSCKIYSHNSGNTYNTSLTTCSCEDCKHKINKNPDYICKHMLAFAIRLNAFKVDPYVMTEQQALCAEREKEFITRAQKAEKELNKLEKRIELLQKEKKSYDEWKEKITVSFPWIAQTLIWIEKKYDDLLLDELPSYARKSEEIVKKVKKEKKELAKRIAELETQIAIFGYFSLERFRGMPLEDFMAIVDNFNKADMNIPLEKAKTPEGIPSGESK